MQKPPLLTDIVIDPSRLDSQPPCRQAELVRQAREAGLLGFLEARIKRTQVNAKLADHLLSAKVEADYHSHMISWEIRQLNQVLAALEGPVILLKGAAYKALELGLSQGRLASDVDLLVPRAQLHTAEQLLLRAGWEAMKEDDYEQQYYREWMHELPPLRHSERGTVVDLHHTIIPPTARITPDPDKLIAAAQATDSSHLFTLCPEDSVLHRAVHLFYDGDLNNSLRELVDIHELLCVYLDQADFPDRLIARARELELARPLYYAIYFCRKLLHSPVPERTETELKSDAPWYPVRHVTCALMQTQLLPELSYRSTPLHNLAAGLLFLRSHWLRMPPLMLARHLLTQVRRRGGITTG